MRRLCSHLSVRQLLSIRDGSRVIELRKCDFSSNLPVIEIPKYLEPQLKTYRKRVEKEEQRLIERKQRSGIRSIPIITSAQKSQYNHYYGQTYVDPDKTIMVSDGWKSGARKGDRIVFHAYSKNPHYVKQFGATESLSNNPFDSNVSWNQIGLSAELLTALHVLLPHAKHMSNIQQLAIPAIQSGANVMLCAETGSGKTLAYAIPLLEAVVQTKRFQDSSATKKRSPRALIVVPSRELAIQTGQVLRTLADPIGVGCSVLVGGEPMQQSQSGFDIVITTIGLVQQHVRRGVYSLRTCRHLVIDEADTLLDDTFDFNLFDLLGNFKFNSIHNTTATQLTLVSATMPHDWRNKMDDFLDTETIQVIQSDRMQKIMSHMEHEFWRVHKHDRVNRFIFECKRRQRSNRPTLIFTNTSRSSRFVWHLLHEHGIDGSHLCKTMTNQERSENLDRFQLGQVHFMVGTDLASRGLDTLRVTDVINFDSPHYVSDYLHRAGRTGRYGGPNRANVATFICFQPDYLMLNALERAVRFDRSAVESDQTIRRTTKRDRKTKDRSSESNRSSDSDHD